MPQLPSNLHNNKLSNTDFEAWQNYVNRIFKSPDAISPSIKYQTIQLHDVLDLHGLTLQQAFTAVQNFILQHQENGSKVITIITGKKGRIKNELPIWCEKFSRIRRCEPKFDSRGEFGSFLIYFYRN